MRPSSITCIDKEVLPLEQLVEILDSDYAGQEKVRQLMLNKTPKYGNDDDYADAIMQEMFESFYCEVNGRKNTKGGVYRINLLPTTCHVYFGSVTGATPDGRKSLDASFRGDLTGAGSGPSRSHGGAELRREDGSCSDGRHAPESEVHPAGP